MASLILQRYVLVVVVDLSIRVYSYAVIRGALRRALIIIGRATRGHRLFFAAIIALTAKTPPSLIVAEFI